MDSQLLIDIAREGNGTFGFIPDALIVGTNFVNSVANILSTYTQSTTLRLVPHGGATFNGDILGFEKSAYSQESWGRLINIGPMQFGAPREIVIPMKIPAGETPYLEAVITFQRDGKDQNVSITGSDRMSNEHSIFAYYRSMAITQALNHYNQTRNARVKARSKAFNSFSTELHTISCTAGSGKPL